MFETTSATSDKPVSSPVVAGSVLVAAHHHHHHHSPNGHTHHMHHIFFSTTSSASTCGMEEKSAAVVTAAATASSSSSSPSSSPTIANCTQSSNVANSVVAANHFNSILNISSYFKNIIDFHHLQPATNNSSNNKSKSSNGLVVAVSSNNNDSSITNSQITDNHTADTAPALLTSSNNNETNTPSQQESEQCSSQHQFVVNNNTDQSASSSSANLATMQQEKKKKRASSSSILIGRLIKRFKRSHHNHHHYQKASSSAASTSSSSDSTSSRSSSSSGFKEEDVCVDADTEEENDEDDQPIDDSDESSLLLVGTTMSSHSSASSPVYSSSTSTRRLIKSPNNLNQCLRYSKRRVSLSLCGNSTTSSSITGGSQATTTTVVPTATSSSGGKFSYLRNKLRQLFSFRSNGKKRRGGGWRGRAKYLHAACEDKSLVRNKPVKSPISESMLNERTNMLTIHSDPTTVTGLINDAHNIDNPCFAMSDELTDNSNLVSVEQNSGTHSSSTSSGYSPSKSPLAVSPTKSPTSSLTQSASYVDHHFHSQPFLMYDIDMMPPPPAAQPNLQPSTQQTHYSMGSGAIQSPTTAQQFQQSAPQSFLNEPFSSLFHSSHQHHQFLTSHQHFIYNTCVDSNMTGSSTNTTESAASNSQQSLLHSQPLIQQQSQLFNTNCVTTTTTANTFSTFKHDLLRISYDKFKMYRLNEKLLGQTVLIRNAIKLLQFDLQLEQEQQQQQFLYQQQQQILDYENSINNGYLVDTTGSTATTSSETCMNNAGQDYGEFIGNAVGLLSTSGADNCLVENSSNMMINDTARQSSTFDGQLNNNELTSERVGQYTEYQEDVESDEEDDDDDDQEDDETTVVVESVGSVVVTTTYEPSVNEFTSVTDLDQTTNSTTSSTTNEIDVELDEDDTTSPRLLVQPQQVQDHDFMVPNSSNEEDASSSIDNTANDDIKHDYFFDKNLPVDTDI